MPRTELPSLRAGGAGQRPRDLHRGPPSDSPLAAFFIWTLASGCHLAASSRALGILRESVAMQMLQRSPHHFLLCVSLGLLFGAAAFGAFIAALLLAPSAVPSRTGGWVVFGLLTLGISARVWPVYTASFVFQGKMASLAVFIRSELAWHGPGFFTAWRMTRTPGTFRRFTVPVLAAWLVVGGAAVTAGTVTHGGAWMTVVALWAFVLSPCLHLLTVGRAEWMRSVAGIPSGRVVSSAE